MKIRTHLFEPEPEDAQKATRCDHHIEKEWKGHMAVLSRRRCKNMTKHRSGYCHLHRRASLWSDLG